MCLSIRLLLTLFLANLPFLFCFSQDITLYTQADVDAFDTSITVFQGNLGIKSIDTDPIVDLSNLNNLVEIQGFLELYDNGSLTNVDGLSNLTTVGDFLEIDYNQSLINLDGFANLSSIGGELKIIANSVLENIDGLSNLVSIGSNLRLSTNINLPNIDAFQNITTLSGDLRISLMNKLQGVNGFSNLTAIDGDLIIESNNLLQDTDGFTNLTVIGEDLRIESNNLLTNLSGFINLPSIGGDVEIKSNLALENIDGLANLNAIGGSILIQSNPVLINVDGFHNLLSIPENLRIESNNSLASLDGFAAIDSIGGNLNLTLNTSLTNLDALSNLNYIGSSLLILFSPLPHVDGLSNLNFIGNGITIQSTSVFQLNGFSNLTSINGNLSLQNNSNLVDLSGFDNLTSIDGNLVINNNSSLTNVNSLLAINTIGNNLQVSNNDTLMNLDGLASISAVAQGLKIFSNENLEDCCGIHQLISTPNAIGGFIEIYFNPSDCSSEVEIIHACKFSAVANAPCLNASNGSIQVHIPTGTLPFAYTWVRQEDNEMGNGISNNLDFIIADLSEGTYHLSIVDATGEEFIIEDISLIPFPGSIFEIIELTTTNSSNGFSNGAIHLTLAGGTPPYTLNWTGQSSGTEMNASDPNFTIINLGQGEYQLTISDNVGNQQSVFVTVLDETFSTFPCTQPLDIVILNDVSGSVDAFEYSQSQQFFSDFLGVTNIGAGATESRAAIVEWATLQGIQIPMTNNLMELQNYVNLDRLFVGATNPQEALIFGATYLEDNARPEATRVIILATDCGESEVGPSIVSLADQYKAAGYHIITIAFDNAFTNDYTRQILQEMASINELAPGAPNFAALDHTLAENIVSTYLCPFDPGSSATAYFNRDGVIDILDIEAINGCPNPENVQLTFSIEALRELSIPTGTPVTFYYNNPALFGATSILTWPVPCSIPSGTTEIFTVTLPITTAANIFAVFNDDGNASLPIAFPITDIDELIFSNNIADTTICTDPLPTLQVFKYTTTPQPICNNLVIYTVNVCNISALDATEVVVTDDAPADFVLLNAIVNDNNCATDTGSNFDIPGGCCVSITYTYDASNAMDGNYNNQDVTLSGAMNQVYLDFDGATTPAENVLIDGTVNCPSTTIEFTKSVNVTEICDESFLVYTFTIDNQLNVPLQGISFTDNLPAPATWTFEPYNLNGLSISNPTISGGNASFIINEIEAETVATFSFDVYLGSWPTDGILENTATLENVLDVENNGLQTLVSNTVLTDIHSSQPILVTQNNNCSTVELSANLNGNNDVVFSWETTGDGTFTDSIAATTTYTFSDADIANGVVILSVSGQSNCVEENEMVTVEVPEMPEPSFINLETCMETPIEFNGTQLNVGDEQDFIFQSVEGCDSIISVSVSSYSSTQEALFFEICGDETIEFNETILTAGAQQDFIFTNEFGCDSIISVTVEAMEVEMDMDIPNAFTPNDDGTNDCFRPYLADASNFENYQLFIYNRWGNQVFSTADPAACWDGTFKNEAAAADVYFWRIEVETTDCYQVSLLQGDVTVIR